VLCDRFADSSRVYQSAVGGADAALAADLERIAVGDVRPDLTFILDLPADVGLARAVMRRGADSADRFEAEAIPVHEKIRAGFLAIAAAEPRRCVVIGGDRGEDEIALDVRAALRDRLSA
jgi:dTMP kinase